MTASHLSGENFWGGGSYVRGRGYVDLPNVGTIRDERLGTRTEGGRLTITERLAWHTRAGERWIDERRTLTVCDVEEASWALEFGTSLRNVRGAPLEFGSPTTNGRPMAGYSGLFWRGPRSFTGGEVIAAGGRGGPEMMGRTARWLAYVGRHDEVDRCATLVFFDDPGYGSGWFVRNTPFPAVNPSLAFDEEVMVEPDQTLTVRYRIVVADGAWDRERLERYAEAHPW
jgi:Methane oxygenase PmoA